MSTVPIFAPDGTLGDIPAANLAAAVKAGAKPGVHITAPDGTPGVVPADRYQEAAKAGAKIDPIAEQPAKDFLSSAGSALWSDLKGMAAGVPSMAKTATEAIIAPPLALQEGIDRIKQLKQNWDARTARAEGVPYKVGAAANEALGVNVKGEEQAAEGGDPGAVFGHAAAVPVAAAVTAGVAKAAPAIAEAAPSAASTALDTTSAILNHPIMKALGKTADVLTFDRLGKIVDAWRGLPDELKARSANVPVPPEVLHDQPSATPEQLNPSLVSPARTLPGQISPERVAPEGPIPGVNARPSIERIMPPRTGLQLPAGPQYPGAFEPQAPSPELLQGNALREGAKPAIDPAKGLGELPVPAVMQAIKELGPSAPIPSLTARANQIANLAVEGAGGDIPKPLQPNVPLKNQGGVVTPKAPAVDLAPGHTPVDSTALSSYKYDPASKEFEVQMKSDPSKVYVFGDAAPEDVAKFEAADSKGKAWHALKDKIGPRVATIVNGKRIAFKPIVSDEDSISPEEWDAGHELGTEVEGSPK